MNHAYITALSTENASSFFDKSTILLLEPRMKKPTAFSVTPSILARLNETLKRQGPITHYNGIDVEQTQDFIKLSSSTYIRKILTDQQWDSGKRTSTRPIPMSGDSNYLRSLPR
jgi:hypothetical protein